MAPARRREPIGEVRDGILAAACGIALERGWPAVTMRRIAERIAYAPPVIYEHFAGRDAILLELRRSGFHELELQMRAAAAGEPTAVERLEAQALAYLDFAQQRPELYQVMFDLGGAACRGPGQLSEAERVVDLARDALAAAVGPVAGFDARSAVLLLGAALHGVAALAMSHPAIVDRARQRELAAAAVATLLAGWRGGAS